MEFKDSDYSKTQINNHFVIVEGIGHVAFRWSANGWSAHSFGVTNKPSVNALISAIVDKWNEDIQYPDYSAHNQAKYDHACGYHN